MHSITRVGLLCLASAHGIDAQSLAQRVTSSDGIVHVIYPSRPTACGDGQTFINNLFGRSTYYSGNSTFTGHGSWSTRPCVHGPARVMVTVMIGEVTRLRSFVGPLPTESVRGITASAAEATAWLGDLALRATPKVASEAMLPLILADAPDPWPLLLRVARDDTRPLSVRRSALNWLSTGVNEHLGIADEGGDTEDDEMRKQAVFALTQRPKSESVPELIELARSAKRPAARRSAIFWLGQSGDMRAVEVFTELLASRR